MAEANQFFAADAPFDIVYRNSGTSFPVKPHTHNALEIYFTLTDLPDVLLNDTVSAVSKGSLIIIPPHNVHQLFNRKLTVYERYIITINSGWLNSTLENAAKLMPYAMQSASPRIIRLSSYDAASLKKMLAAFLENNTEPSILGYSNLFALLGEIDRMINKDLPQQAGNSLTISSAQQKVNDTISYINRHLSEPLTIETIADEFHVNKDYLGRLFKEHTHATIGHYISVQRAGLAQSMLAEGHTVSQVQEALGFTSYAYFFKFFKKMTGISPSRFRRLNQHT